MEKYLFLSNHLYASECFLLYLSSCNAGRPLAWPIHWQNASTENGDMWFNSYDKEERVSSLYEEKQSCAGTSVAVIERVRLMDCGKDTMVLLIV